MPRNDIIRRFPVLSRHWPDFPPPEDEPPTHVRDLKLRRDCERLHSLPARVTFELLREIGASRQIQTIIEERTAAFAAVDPDQLSATGGDRFPAWPVREVRS